MSIAVLRAKLTEDDVRRLVRGEADEDRALAAHKICRRIGEGALTPAERAAAHDILMMMAQDAAVMVRRALAVTLRSSPHLPRDVAIRLGEDIDEIAAPVLEDSPVFEIEDLMALVAAGTPAKQLAIAGRAQIPAPVVAALVTHGGAAVVARAAANDGAEFDAPSYETALARFGALPEVAEAFVDRAHLPPTVAERLVALVSDQALARLVRRHALPPQLAVELAEGARERATFDILDQAGRQPDMRRFVQQLQLNGRLTPSIVLRGLCLGHMTFFEHAMAELAGVPHHKAWMLIHDAGPLGLKAIFERAGLPGRLYPAIRSAIDVYHEIEFDGGPEDRARFTQIMIERVLSRAHAMSRDETDYLLDKLDALSADMAAEANRARGRA